MELSQAWPPSVTIKNHPRAKQVKLKATLKHGLELIVPPRFNVKEVPLILEQNKEWIKKQLLKLHSAQQSVKELELPVEIQFPALNQVWRVSYVASSGRLQLITRPHQELVLMGNLDNKKNGQRLLASWVREQAVFQLTARLLQVSHRIQLPYQKVSIRDQQTRWGSCSSDKSICLNYKLLFLSPALMDHVLIHELCHTVYLNHAEKFWRLVASFDPEWQVHRRALRKANQCIPIWVP